MKTHTHFTNLLCAIGLFFTPFIGFSQQVDIKSWQSANPHVEFISHDRFNNLSDIEKQILSKREYIVFYKEIKESDINVYAEKKGINGIVHNPPTKATNDAQFIKEWIDQHRDVKIITQSVFNHLNSAEQQYVSHDSKHLVLQSDEITKEDLLNFNNRPIKHK